MSRTVFIHSSVASAESLSISATPAACALRDRPVPSETRLKLGLHVLGHLSASLSLIVADMEKVALFVKYRRRVCRVD